MSIIGELFHNLGNSHNLITVGAEVIKEELRGCIDEQNPQTRKERLQKSINDLEQMIKGAHEANAITCQLHDMACRMLEAAPAISQDDGGKKRLTKPKSRLKLLIVDDEKEVCNFGQSYFAKCGFDTHTAYSGQQALRLAERIKPDIAIIDMYLGEGLNGLEIIRQLSQLSPNCKCIMITWDKTKASEAILAGAVHFHHKPIKIAELEKSIHEIMKKFAYASPSPSPFPFPFPSPSPLSPFVNPPSSPFEKGGKRGIKGGMRGI